MSSRVLRVFATSWVVLFSVFFAYRWWHLSGGDVINYYPFISPDGFDWYLEGIYLTEIFRGVQGLGYLPILRPPVFVFVAAADYLSGANGIVLGLMSAFSIFLTYIFSLKLVNNILGVQNTLGWHAIFIAIGVTIYPLNFIRPYLLADGLAIMLALGSIAMLCEFQNSSRRGYAVIAIILAGIAGLTQTYALLPFLIMCGVGTLFNLSKNKFNSSVYFFSGLVVVLMYIAGTVCWRSFMPHRGTPENFTLLQFSGNMLNFYVQTWSFYFLPLAIFFCIPKKYKLNVNPKDLMIKVIALIVIIFGLLSFFYQWPEARFTYYLWPWVMILFCATVVPFSRLSLFLIINLMVALIFLVPQNYWAPSWKSVKFSPSQSWAAQYFSAISVDRKLNSCSEQCETQNEFLKYSDDYVKSTIKLYLKIKEL